MKKNDKGCDESRIADSTTKRLIDIRSHLNLFGEMGRVISLSWTATACSIAKQIPQVQRSKVYRLPGPLVDSHISMTDHRNELRRALQKATDIGKLLF